MGQDFERVGRGLVKVPIGILLAIVWGKESHEKNRINRPVSVGAWCYRDRLCSAAAPPVPKIAAGASRRP